jgi:hypothetical protein
MTLLSSIKRKAAESVQEYAKQKESERKLKAEFQRKKQKIFRKEYLASASEAGMREAKQKMRGRQIGGYFDARPSLKKVRPRRRHKRPAKRIYNQVPYGYYAYPRPLERRRPSRRMRKKHRPSSLTAQVNPFWL